MEILIMKCRFRAQVRWKDTSKYSLGQNKLITQGRCADHNPSFMSIALINDSLGDSVSIDGVQVVMQIQVSLELSLHE